MDVLVLLEHESQVVNVVLQVSSLLSVLFVDIGVSGLVLDLLFHVFLVQSDDSSLQLFEVSDVMENLEDIILEFLLVALLLVQLLPQVFDLGGQTLLSHSQIVNDQSQVLVHPVKMLQLLPHDVGLLLKLLDLDLSWADVSLQFLDFIIQDELELFELLSFLFKVQNSLIFVLDGGFSLLELRELRGNLLLQVVGGLVELIELLGLLLNLFLLVISFLLLGLEIVVNEGQVALSLHTSIDFLGEELLIFVLEIVDLDPSVVFNSFSLGLMSLHHLLDLFLKSIGLGDLAI